MNNTIESLFSETQQLNVQGQWFVVQWSPDPATDERLNIGVGIKDKDGTLSLQMLDYFDRIKCLYGEEMIFHASLACTVAREAVLISENLTKDLSPMISISPKGFTQGHNVESVLSHLFQIAVPLGKKIHTRKDRTFSATSRDSIYNSLRESLKEKLELEFSTHAPENPYIQIPDRSNTFHNVYVPFRKTNGLGTLASAAYADVNRVKLNLLEGYRDLDTAQTHRQVKHTAFFFLLPGDDLAPEKWDKIDRNISEITWHMKKKGVHIGSHTSIDELGEDISEWCSSNAA